MLYNCGSWALTDSEAFSLDACHRKHLRSILGVRWPNRISNTSLYEVCGCTALSHRVRKARWRLFGHILRLDRDAPAQVALDFAMNEGHHLWRARRGRPPTCLLTVLRADLKPIGLTMKNASDLRRLRELASNKDTWRGLGRQLTGD